MAGSTVTVSRPSFEHHRDALGIGESEPRISWRIDAPPGWTQRAYEIEVTDPVTGTVELSGPVESTQSQLVAWPATALQSRQRRTVRVRAWGTSDARASDWSDAAPVETGLLQPGDWVGTWAGPVEDGEHTGARPAWLVRKRFGADREVRQARLYVTAHGIFEVELNGHRVGLDVLAPGWSTYHDRLRYHTYDVTDQIRAGENAIGAWLADGWYRGRMGFQGGHWNLYGSQTALLAQLEIDYTDGSRQVVASGPDWSYAAAPITATGLYEGETYDARLDRPGWSTPLGDDTDWAPVRTSPLEARQLTAPDGPPVRATQTLRPVAITESPAGRTLIDFGQNISGRVRLTVTAAHGDQITVRHAEVLEHGELGVRPLRTADATDTYIAHGDGVEVWEPRFTMHGFRYAEVTGWPGVLTPDDITAIVYHSDMARTGWFESSDDALNQLHDNVVWSMRGNFVDVPTDCPQRDERLGWTGDITIFAPTASFLYDCAGMLTSWLADVAAEQTRFGTVPYYVPWIPQEAFPFGPAAVWGDAAVLVPWALYERFGDLELLRTQYPSMTAWVDQVTEAAGDSDLWETGFQFGDWLDPAAPPEDPADARTDRYLVASAYRAHSLETVSAVAALLGDTSSHARYSALARRCRSAFAARFIGPDGHMLGDAQAGYALALQFGLVADPRQAEGAGRRLAELVRADGYRIGTGFVGTPLLCDALTAAGELDTAYGLLLETGCPSWLYPVSMGATTIWERWDSMLPDGNINPGGMTSFNHYALGAVADWLHRTVAGLAPAEPGYRRIAVRPLPGGGLTHASAEHVTPYGLASVAWTLDHNATLTVRLCVPTGTTADVDLPIEGFCATTVGSGEHQFSGTHRAPDLHAIPTDVRR